MQTNSHIMQPCREMPVFESWQHFPDPQFDPNSTTHDDFLEQIFSRVPSSWAAADLEYLWDPLSYAADDYPINAAEYFHYDDLLTSQLRHHQINGAASPPEITNPVHHEQMVNIPGLAHPTDFLNYQGGDHEALFSGFNGASLHGADTTSDQNLYHLAGAAPNFVAPATVMNLQAAEQLNGSSGGAGVAPAQLKQRVRARRGQATDPHSIAERLRRERIAERMKALQELVPNANKTDKASMLDEIIEYVKSLQLQVKVQSMSAAAAAPLVPDMCPKIEGGGDCNQTSRNANGNNHTASSNDSLTVTEHQVTKLMEEDMGSAVQYLQDKGLCLVPISVAFAISTGNTMINGNTASDNAPALVQTNGVEGSSLPSMSDSSDQSTTMGFNDGYI